MDDRPPTWWARIYVIGMRLRRDKDAFRGAENTRRVALARQVDGDAPPTWWTRRRLRVSDEHLEGMRVWRVRPRRRSPLLRVVYLHGGGYVHPLTPDYWRLVRALATVPAEVVVPAYPLAPGATVDDVLPRLRALLGDDTTPTVVAGDSAGGALALVLSRLATDEGQPPVAVVALCPWLDPELREHEVHDLEATDPMLDESGLRAAARWWAGDRDLDDPCVAPLLSELDGLPPVEVFVGDRDILRPAVDRLADRAERAAVRLTVHETTAMFHVWMTRLLPEARRTRRQLVSLLRRAGGPEPVEPRAV